MLIATQNPGLSAGEFLLGLAFMIPDGSNEFQKGQFSQQGGYSNIPMFSPVCIPKALILFENFPGSNE